MITKDADLSKVGEQPDGAGVPAHIGNAWMSYKTGNKWRASIGYQWQGNRQHDLPAYHRFDANVSVNLKTITIAVVANNITDKYLFSGAPFEYNNDPASTEYYFQAEPGLNFRINVTCRF
jgi:iron complex outermembrane recepter protein